MNGRDTSEQAEQFNALLRQAILLETKELDAFLEGIDDPEIKKQIDSLVKTADPATVMQFKTGIAGNTGKFLAVEGYQLLPGEKVGRFRVEKVIAQGGMGLVYLGYDELLGRQVAIKTIRPDHVFKSSTQQRFVREAQILSKINDSRICQIYDFIEQSGCEYIVLEYINGKNLNHRDLNLTQSEKLNLFVQLAGALSSAHQQGIVHRDLKPDNLMVTDGPSLKILDFGIARSAVNDTDSIIKKPLKDEFTETKLTVEGSIMGTLRYMSPEQINGKKVTAASDMYAVGVILQETMTGEIAYDLKDIKDLMDQVSKAELVTPKNLHHSLQTIISDLTQLDPAQRLTATELIKRLKHLIEKPRRIRRNVLSFMLVFLIIMAAWFWNTRYEEAHKTQLFNDYILKSDELGNQLNQIFTLPIHDITSELSSLHSKAMIVLGEIDRQQSFTDDEQNYLKGLTLKKVNDFDNAVHYLEQSWLNGYRNDEIIHQLAEAAVLLWWNAEFNGFLTLRPDSETEHLKQQAHKYSQLSKDYAGSGNSIASAYQMWRSGQYDQALEMVDQVLATQDWQYTGYLLKAAIYTEKMIQLDTIRTPQQSYEMSLDAIKAYRLAVERARSHPESYMGLCQMNKRIIRDALTNTGYGVESFFNEGVTACEQALLIQPKNPYVRALLASLHVTFAEIQMQKGADLSGLLEKAKEWTDQDIALFTKDSSYFNKAEIHSKLAQVNNRKGINPKTEIELAVAAYKKAAELNPNTVGETTVGILYNLEILAQYQLANGIDFSATFNEAQTTYNNFDKLDSKSLNVYLTVVHMNTAAIYYLYGKFLLLKNEAVDDVIEAGLKLLAKHPVLFDRESFIHGIRAQLYTVLAKQQLKLNQDATSTIELLNSNIERALSLFPTQNELLLIKANGLFIQLQNIKQLDKSNSVASEDIKLIYQQAIDANPQFAPTYVDYAKFLLFLSQYADSDNKQQETINDAIKLCDSALNVNPQFAEAFAVKADLFDLFGGQDDKVQSLKLRAGELNPLFN